MGEGRLLPAALVGLTLAAGAAIAVFRVDLGTILYARGVTARAGRDAVATLPDGLHVALCGTGSPLPDPSRAGPCALIVAGHHVILVDAGEGSARSLARMTVPAGRIEAVFLTHFHSDPIDGLGPVMLMRWTGRPWSTPLPIYGPTGVAAVVAGINVAYAADAGYRVAHHGARIVPPTGAADDARASGVRALVLTHLVPPLPWRLFYPAFTRAAADHFAGPITVGEDGMLFTLLPGSTAVVQTRLS